MKQFYILLKKEFLESSRNFKWVWMPLVFILLGLLQPITTYYMPKILASSGDLPEGVISSIPIPTAPEVLFGTIDQQFNLIGILVIALAFMSSIPGEKKSGSAALLLVKPVSVTAYILSKWGAAMILIWVSYALGMLASWYYTYQLFAPVDVSDTVKVSLVYGLWLTFIVTLVIFFGCFLKSSGVNAFLTLGVTIVLSFIPTFLKNKALWLPSKLDQYTGEIMQSKIPDGAVSALIVTGVAIVLLLAFGITFFKRKELI